MKDVIGVSLDRVWKNRNKAVFIEIETKNGSIESIVGDGDDIHVKYEKWATGIDEQDAKANIKDIKILTNEDPSSGILSIVIDTPKRPGINYGCNVSLNLPASIFLDVKSSNGAIAISGSQGGMSCSTSNGAITIENTSGYAQIETSNGKITAINHNGNMNARTSNGAIDAGVLIPEGGECILRTSNGTINLAIPEETSALITASTSNGKIEVDDIGITLIKMEKTEFEGAMGDSAGNIQLETSNGSIRIMGRW